MAGNVIYDAERLSWRVMLEIDSMHIEGGEYFYKYLVESIRSMALAAYDSYRGIFICQPYLLPAQAEAELAAQFARVVHPSQQVVDVAHLPTSLPQFQALVVDWMGKQAFGQGCFEWKEINMPRVGKMHAFIREHEFFIEICELSLDYRGELKVGSLSHDLIIKPLVNIVRWPMLSIVAKGIRYKGEHVINWPHDWYIHTPEQMKECLNEVKKYFEFIDPYVGSLSGINDLFNHNEDLNVKKWFSHTKAPGIVPLVLALAKLVNDPAYVQLYTQWEADFKQDEGEQAFNEAMRGEYAYLTTLQPVENI